ncbi:hypothetical protein [Pedobacter sp.]|uniref:hypothetical protein n=1 Tax=Pedobacter sp. TaxID=1411316 RepID=UPI0031DCC515
MKLQKVSLDKRESSLIKLYRNRAFDELMNIRPSWAFGNDSGKLWDRRQLPSYQTYTIFKVDTAELVNNSLFYEVDVNQLFTNDLTNNYRVARILYNWENGTHLDPPTLSLRDDHQGKLTFLDGRHRTKVSYLLGFKMIPLAVELIDVEAVRTIITLNDY